MKIAGQEECGGKERALDDRVRRGNAVLAVALAVFLIAHEVLGALSVAVSLPTGLRWLIWAGAVGIAAHVAFCVATSYWMMTDTVRPPSVHKRNHLILKWASGAMLAAMAVLHAVLGGTPYDFATSVVAAVLGIILAWHTCVGVKSALRDLGRGKQHRTAIRAVVIAATAVVVVLLAVL